MYTNIDLSYTDMTYIKFKIDLSYTDMTYSIQKSQCDIYPVP